MKRWRKGDVLMQDLTPAPLKVAQAEAEAQALRLQKQEITPELIKLREIEAQRLAIEKWNGVLPNVTGGAVPFINVGQ